MHHHFAQLATQSTQCWWILAISKVFYRVPAPVLHHWLNLFLKMFPLQPISCSLCVHILGIQSEAFFPDFSSPPINTLQMHPDLRLLATPFPKLQISTAILCSYYKILVLPHSFFTTYKPSSSFLSCKIKSTNIIFTRMQTSVYGH